VALRSWADSASQGSLARSTPDLAVRMRKVLKARPEWTAFFLKIATHTLGLGADAAQRGEQRGPCPLGLPARRTDDASHLLRCDAVQQAVSPGFPPEATSWASDPTLSLPDRLGLLSEAGVALRRSQGCRDTFAFSLLCSQRVRLLLRSIASGASETSELPPLRAVSLTLSFIYSHLFTGL